jgi:hypothetical protein
VAKYTHRNPTAKQTAWEIAYPAATPFKGLSINLAMVYGKLKEVSN